MISSPTDDVKASADHLLGVLAGTFANPAKNNAALSRRHRRRRPQPRARQGLWPHAGYDRDGVADELVARAVNRKGDIAAVPIAGEIAGDDDAPVPALRSRQSVVIIVAGGGGLYSMAMPSWAAGPHRNPAVIKEIDLFPACEIPSLRPRMRDQMNRNDWRTTLRDPEGSESLMTGQLMCRLATLNDRGPHITPVGFVWDGSAVWIASQFQTQRFVDLQRNRRVAVVVEPGDRSMFEGYVEIIGEAQVVGSVPCMGADPQTAEIERLFPERTQFSLDLVHDGLHAWVRIEPQKVVQVLSVIAKHDDPRVYLDEALRMEERRAGNSMRLISEP